MDSFLLRTKNNSLLIITFVDEDLGECQFTFKFRLRLGLEFDKHLQ